MTGSSGTGPRPAHRARARIGVAARESSIRGPSRIIAVLADELCHRRDNLHPTGTPDDTAETAGARLGAALGKVRVTVGLAEPPTILEPSHRAVLAPVDDCAAAGTSSLGAVRARGQLNRLRPVASTGVLLRLPAGGDRPPHLPTRSERSLTAQPLGDRQGDIHENRSPPSPGRRARQRRNARTGLVGCSGRDGGQCLSCRAGDLQHHARSRLGRYPHHDRRHPNRRHHVSAGGRPDINHLPRPAQPRRPATMGAARRPQRRRPAPPAGVRHRAVAVPWGRPQAGPSLPGIGQSSLGGPTISGLVAPIADTNLFAPGVVASGPRSTVEFFDLVRALALDPATAHRILAPFPVFGPARYTDDWLALRCCPFRLHQGIDIAGPRERRCWPPATVS